MALGRPGDTSDPNGHGTHVAGSVLGDGTASGGQYQGVAPEAQAVLPVAARSSGRLGGLPVALAELFEAGLRAGARIHNNSWGSATASAYTIDSTEVDDFVGEPSRHAVRDRRRQRGRGRAALNAQPGFVDWLSIGSPASCKNALTVGASRSSRTTGGSRPRPHGARSGRQVFPSPPIAGQQVSGDPAVPWPGSAAAGPATTVGSSRTSSRPGTDIVSARSATGAAHNFWGPHQNPQYAYMGGTSMAAPLVAGCAALVRQYYVDERRSQPSAALLKATLINGTRGCPAPTRSPTSPARPTTTRDSGRQPAGTIPNPSSPAAALEFVDPWKQPALQFRSTGQRFRFGIDVGRRAAAAHVAGLHRPARARPAERPQPAVQQPDGRSGSATSDVPQELELPDPDNNVEVIRIDSRGRRLHDPGVRAQPAARSRRTSRSWSRARWAARCGGCPDRRRLMLIDLHAHYPMRVIGDVSPDTALRALRQAARPADLARRVRAVVLRIASTFFSHRNPFSGYRVTVEGIRAGGVGVALSVLTRPFDEVALGLPYASPPAVRYFEGLLTDLEAVEPRSQATAADVIRMVHGRDELEQALGDGATALVHCVEGGFSLGDGARRGRAQRRRARPARRRVHHARAPALPAGRDELLGVPVPSDRQYRVVFPQPEGVGLTDRGVAALRAMVRNRVLLDISHMRQDALRETFALLDDELDPRLRDARAGHPRRLPLRQAGVHARRADRSSRSSAATAWSG